MALRRSAFNKNVQHSLFPFVCVYCHVCFYGDLCNGKCTGVRYSSSQSPILPLPDLDPFSYGFSVTNFRVLWH